MSGVDTERAPIGFRVVVAAAALYLVVRLIQIGVWLVQRLS